MAEPTNPELLEKLNIIDLLGVCAEGGKKRAEEIGQSFFSKPDLLE